MKKIISQILAVGMLASTLSSCNFLDLKPEHSFVDNDMLVSYADAEAAVNGIYLNLLKGKSQDAFAGGLFVGLTHRAGFFKHKDFLPEYEETLSAEKTNGTDLWNSTYVGVNYANFAINGIIGMAASAFPTEAHRTKLLGEARLFRAWYNIFLLNNFAHWWEKDDSPYGILYRDQVAALDNLQKSRLNVGDSYARILDDLDYAIANCPSIAEHGDSKKMSKEYALVLKAKLLLFRGTAGMRDSSPTDLSAALSLVNELLASLPANWIIEPDMAQMYKNSFDSKENLFVRYTPDWNSVSMARNTSGYTYGYNTAYFPGSVNTVASSDGKEVAHDPTKFDAGFTAVNLDWIKEDPRWSIVTGIARNAENWDLGRRFMVTKLYRGGFYHSDDNKFNVYYFRLYELYLLKAELILRTGGSYTDALAVLNDVRSKRTNPVLPALPASSAKEVYQLIYKEIVCELFWENGAEYYASLRFDSPDGDKYIAYNKKGDNISTAWNQQAYPIPSGEMNNNELMVQNPY